MLKLYPLLIFSFLPFALLAQEIQHENNPINQDVETVRTEPARAIKKNGKFGWVESTGQTLIPFEYDTIIYTSDNYIPYFIVKQNSLYGVLNGKGKVIIEPAYQELKHWTVSFITAETEKWPAGDLLFRAKKDEKWGFINNHNKVILPFEYSFIRCEWHLVFVAQKEDKWGMVNWKREIKAPFQYDEMEGISKGYRVRMGKLNGIITNNGKFILPVRYSTIKPFMNSMLEFEYWYLVTGTNSKKGLLKAEKQWLAIPVQYDNIADVNTDNIIIAVSANKYGVINAQNKILIPFQYDQLKFLSLTNNAKPLLARVKGKYGLIDLTNKKHIPFAYDDLQPVADGFYKACNNGKCKVLNASGRTITKEEYDNIGVYINGKAPVFKNGQISYIDTFGVAGDFVPSDACGYTDLHKLLADLTMAMNAKNDSLLHVFCKNITPDKQTISFLKRSRYKNHTILNDIERMRAYTESRQQEIFDEIKKISSTMQDTQHTPWTAAYVPTQYDRLTKLEIEPFCIESIICNVSLRSGAKELIIALGGLTRMDGYWKTSYVPFVAGIGIPPVK